MTQRSLVHFRSSLARYGVLQSIAGSRYREEEKAATTILNRAREYTGQSRDKTRAFDGHYHERSNLES
jgi:hypothetical protein